ncbi:MAG: Calx-beta domain-containing protein [Solirubrobacteraceae bacterium]
MKRPLLVLLLAVVGLATTLSTAGGASAVTMSIGDPTQTDVTATNPGGTEGTGANTTMTFPVTLSGPAPQGGVSVDYTTLSGTATPGVDYQTTSGTLVIPEGEPGGSVVVTVIGDALDEPDETFRVALTNAVPNGVVSIAGGGVGTGTIPDDDDAPSITVADADVQGGAVSTGTNRLVIFDVKLSAPSGRTVSVDYATEDDTAIACTKQTCDSPDDGDYVPLVGTLTFNPGVTSLQLSVVAIGDSLDVNKQFRLRLRNTTHLRSASTQFRTSDVGLPVTIRPGTPGAQTTTITGITTGNAFDVTLADPVENGQPVPFSFTPTYTDGVLVGGTTLTSTSARFTTADAGKAITVAGVPSTIFQYQTPTQIMLADDPGLPVNTGIAFSYLVDRHDASLLGGVHQTIGRPLALGRIKSAGPVASIGNATVTEGPAGRETAVALTVTLDDPSPQPLSVVYATADGTAKAGEDYRATSGRLTFAAGQTSRTITVPVRGNALHQADRSFTVTLKDPVDVRLGSTGKTATVRITDDDAAPRVKVADTTIAEPLAATSTASVVVSLTGPSGKALDVEYRTADGTARAGVHYQASSGKLTFAPGETSKTIAISVAGDGLVTDDQAFHLIATDTDGSPVRSTVTIVDGDLTDDLTPRASVNDVTVRLGDGDPVARFTVRLDRALTRTSLVAWRTVDGSAKAGRDYLAGTGALVFAPGQLTATVDVPVVADDLPANRTFSLELYAPVAMVLGDASGDAVLIPTSDLALAGSVSGRSVRSSTVLCRKGRRCAGLRVGWTAPSRGRVRAQIRATVPRTGKKRGSGSGTKADTVIVVADRRVTARRKGRGNTRVKRAAGARTNTIIAKLRKAKVRRVTVRITHVDRLGRQRAYSRTVRLRQ